MKKIVGIIAAVAMAGSLFAADFTMKSQINANLFNVTSSKVKDDTVDPWTIADKTDVTVLGGLAQGKNANYAEMIGLSISDDKAGGEMKVWAKDGKDPSDLVVGKYSVWFKPIDMIKITIGNWDTNLNQESIGWCRSASGAGSQGFTVSAYPMDGLSFDLTFAPGWGNNWISTNDDGKKYSAGGWKWDKDATVKGVYADAEAVKIEETALKVTYSADGIGTINALFDAKPYKILDKKDGTTNIYKKTDDSLVADNSEAYITQADGTVKFDEAQYYTVTAGGNGEVWKNFGDIKFGAGYKNTFGDITVWANVLGYVNYNNQNLDKTTYKATPAANELYFDQQGADSAKQTFEKVRLELDAKQTIDALSWEVFLPVDIYIDRYANAAWTSKFAEAKIADMLATDGKSLAKAQWEIDNLDDAELKKASQINFDSYAKRVPVAVGFVGKVGYALDNGMTASFEAEVNNFLATDMNISLKPKVEGTVGLLSWNAALSFGITTCGHYAHTAKVSDDGKTWVEDTTDATRNIPHNKFSMSVPVEFSLAF